MGLVLRWLVGGSVGARREVGQAALVCRVWRDVAVGERSEVWGVVVQEMMPAISMCSGAIWSGGRQYIAAQGRCVADVRRWDADRWWEGLRLHFEVWDEMDGLRLLSAEGPMEVDGEGTDRIGISVSLSTQLIAPAFPVELLQPGYNRFIPVNHFGMPDPTDPPSSVRTRVVVSDEQTVRQGLLCSGDEIKWTIQPGAKTWGFVC